MIEPAMLNEMTRAGAAGLAAALATLAGEFGAATVMIQREVADRLAAAPGSRDYGSLSVLFQLHSDVERLFDVGGSGGLGCARETNLS